jgi:hypothetical protein
VSDNDAPPSSGVSLQEQADFGAARDILDDLIGFATAEIRASEPRDPARAASWRRRRDEWVSRRRALRPGDADAIHGVLAYDAAQLRVLTAR